MLVNLSRNPAKRVFASELNEATYSFTRTFNGVETTFTLLPTGERAHNVWIVGVLTSLKDVGKASEYWRSRVVDGADGTFFVCARPQYQPDPVATLKSLSPPVAIGVLGKIKSYSPADSDDKHVYVEPESIAPLPAHRRDQWVVEAAARTQERIISFDVDESQDAALAAEKYPDTSPKQYWEPTVRALSNCATDSAPTPDTSTSQSLHS